MNITIINRMMGIKFGGGENFDLNIARALKKRGHNIRFIIGITKKYQIPRNIEKEFQVIKIKTPYLRKFHYSIKPTSFFNKIISALALEIDLRLFEIKTLFTLRNDNWTEIYQICGLPWLGAKLKIINNKKSVIIWPGPPNKIKLKWMKRCDINIANGDALKKIREELLPEVKEINPGVDIKKFYPIQKKAKKNIEYLFVGRIIPIKNISFLIKAFKEAIKEKKDLVLNIVGNGDQKEEETLKKMSKSIPNIKFLGEKKGKELIKIYQKSDVFCLTSHYDNFPNVILEAMACGLPVIATKVGGIPLQVKNNETGLLVDPDNITQLKNAILKLAHDKTLREKMGKAGRKRIEQEFSWDKSAKQLEKIYIERLKDLKKSN